MKINDYIIFVRNLLNENTEIEKILEELRKKNIPPGFAAILLHKTMRIKMTEANKIVYGSETYKGLGKINDIFLDRLTSDGSNPEIN